MLENTEDQPQANTSTTDGLDFVTAVRDRIVSMNPRFGEDPALLDRLAMAYGDGKRMGLTQDELLAEFLYLKAEVPGFYLESAISTWLEKPGAPIDCRFKVLLDVLRKNLDQGPEER